MLIFHSGISTYAESLAKQLIFCPWMSDTVQSGCTFDNLHMLIYHLSEWICSNSHILYSTNYQLNCVLIPELSFTYHCRYSLLHVTSSHKHNLQVLSVIQLPTLAFEILKHNLMGMCNIIDWLVHRIL
jgi:hypothetical protein